MERSVMWSGPLKLKKTVVKIKLTHIEGNGMIALNNLVPHHSLEIQRIINDEHHLLPSRKRHRSCVLLGQAYGLNADQQLQSSADLKRIIKYLHRQKCAGIIDLFMSAYTAQVYPPSPTTRQNLRRMAPELFFRISPRPYVLVYVFKKSRRDRNREGS